MSNKMQYRPDLFNCKELAEFAEQEFTDYDQESCEMEEDHAHAPIFFDLDGAYVTIMPGQWVTKNDDGTFTVSDG